MAGTKHDAELFVERWRGKGNEDQDTQLFWIGLFQDVLGLTDALDRLKFEQPVYTAASEHQGYIDVLIPSAQTIVEQKSLGVDLSKPEMRQGRQVTPVQQALGYVGGMGLSQKPRYIVACNFSEFWVYDTETDPLCKGEPLKIALEDIPDNLPAIQFLAGKGEAPEVIQRKVDVQAGQIMGRVHAAVAESFEAAGFDRNDDEVHHAISTFCTRIMFLMFCEDQDGLIPPNCFRDYIQHYDADGLRKALLDLFEWLDTPEDKRDPFASDLLKAFPYMNGGLFAERTQIPTLNEDVRTTIIVEGCQEFDWSSVNPTVFGSIFEGSLSHDERRSGGMHYTSPENIHKVIDPLFLDALEEEYIEACQRSESGGARTKALEALHDKIGRISILDPACGSGNFLTESYMCLRRLENRILFEQSKDKQSSFDFEGDTEGLGADSVRVSLKNFHGIELNDFACAVARTALWIAEKQADTVTANIVRRIHDELPLTDYGTIHQGNALRIDWNDVVPASECTYICGNPPFIGKKEREPEQTADMELVFPGERVGNLDYVASWFRKAADYSESPNTKCAFVSTNSITMGEQPILLWPYLFDHGFKIAFARRTFEWDSLSNDKAHVHCVIIGLQKSIPKQAVVFDGDKKINVTSINAYLREGGSEIVRPTSRPLCKVPELIYGSMPIDDGNLILNREEAELVRKTEAAPAVRPYLGGQEFLKGVERWCLWFDGIDPMLATKSELVRDRIEKTRSFRLSSNRPQTVKAAEKPYLFGEIRQPSSDMLVIPKVSSQNRKYIPIGFIEPHTIVNGSALIMPNATLYLFGILSSQAHNAWMRAVAGRMKSDYQYSVQVVYNTFQFPCATEDQIREISILASKILDIRMSHCSYSIANLYDNKNEPLLPDLYSAHRALDAAVEAAYDVDFNGDEEKIVAHLFKLYAEKTRGE